MPVVLVRQFLLRHLTKKGYKVLQIIWAENSNAISLYRDGIAKKHIPALRISANTRAAVRDSRSLNMKQHNKFYLRKQNRYTGASKWSNFAILKSFGVFGISLQNLSVTIQSIPEDYHIDRLIGNEFLLKRKICINFPNRLISINEDKRHHRLPRKYCAN